MSNERGRLRAVPSVLGDARLPTPQRACKRPLCGNVVSPPSGRSRPPVFCSANCRRKYSSEKAAARAAFLEAKRLAAQYDIAPHELELRSGAMPTDVADYAGLVAAAGGWWQDLTWLKEVLRVLGRISGDGRHVLNSVDGYVRELREEERWDG